MLMIDRATENIASLYSGITGKPLSSLTVADFMLLREEAVSEIEKGLFTVDNGYSAGCHEAYVSSSDKTMSCWSPQIHQK